jgi:hypothetical protein
MALQSRLDLCALAMLKKREKLAGRLVWTNRTLEATALGIYASRGLSVLGGPIAAWAGAVGEKALLQLNHAAAHWQDADVLLTAAGELASVPCAHTPFSRKPALCQATPRLKSALQRSPTLFPDVKGPLRFLSAPLGRFECRSKNMATRLRLEGDPHLKQERFSDAYEK